MTIDLCKFLRWKGHARDADAAELRFTFERNQVTYSCLRTCQPWGPDDELAAPEGCHGGRACHVPARPLVDA